MEFWDYLELHLFFPKTKIFLFSSPKLLSFLNKNISFAIKFLKDERNISSTFTEK
jgi:hypothetical protein